MNSIIVPAPAKINLALDIKGVRDDGFHEVEMIMQSISLHDIITINKNSGGIRLTTSDPALPLGKENIAYRAAEAIIKKTDLFTGVDIDIRKKIPIAGGLAGGSTNAAAVLLGINSLYDLNLDDSFLLDIAGELGSDVPFCLHGGTAFAYGRGEKLRQLADLRRLDLVIVNPGIEISTALAYSEYDQLKVKRGVSIDKLIRLIEDRDKISWTEGWENVLEDVASTKYEDISIIKEMLKNMGALFTLMSGSGSTVFAIVKDQKTGERIRTNWSRKEDFVTTAWTIKKDFFELRRI